MMMKIMMKINYDEIWVKTASKCLARMKGYWDLEFEPSVEEIVDYRRYNIYGDSLGSLSLANSLYGGISLFSLSTWQVEVMSGSTCS